MYHYAGNNPIRYVDPDGRENKDALKFMQEKLKGISPGYWYFDKDGNSVRNFKKGEIPNTLYCYQAVFCAYANSGITSLPMTRWAGIQFFKNNTEVSNKGKTYEAHFIRDITKAEIGDIVFLGKDTNMDGHAVIFESYESISEDKVIMNVYGAYSPDNYKIGPEKMTFTKDSNDNWICSHNNYDFKGFGQLKEITNE